MFGLIGNIAGAALGGPIGSAIGGAIGGAIDGGGSGGGGADGKSFDDALSGFAMQIAQDAMGEMDQAMQDTDEEFE
ncbi:hypothetical protein [Methylobacterium brachythecii]|uniref:Outer membrane lipoprotein SlyB n=1 Tax=Methylobacterium brachythecii TaxID=1176177 RepID=A0A7W6F7P6_9HYPH|nr:hypothetical protein [Methylobacterium brachythecii]MBB3903306.1 outer membrane lipoprotein SlyB [Methylobacterium brachythecii]GLS46844.1 hypothetical protein GCM10007884_48410 [Methylobacterium brachythecii]